MAAELGVADEALKYVLGAGGVMAVLVWFFSFSRNRIEDDSTRSSVIKTLREQLEDANRRMELERQRADEFAKERNDALTEFKALQQSVGYLTEQMVKQGREMEVLQQELERAEAENRAMRQFVHDMMVEINRFTKANPVAAASLNLPEYPAATTE